MDRFSPPYASFVERASASLVDGAIGMVIQILGGFLGAFLFASFTPSDSIDPVEQRRIVALGQFVGMLFWATAYDILNRWVLQGLTGASIGKRALGIRITLETGEPITFAIAIKRSFASILSMLPFYAGFLAPLWSPKRQTFHDSVCKTVVLKTRPAQRLELPAPVILLPSPSQKKDVA